MKAEPLSVPSVSAPGSRPRAATAAGAGSWSQDLRAGDRGGIAGDGSEEARRPFPRVDRQGSTAGGRGARAAGQPQRALPGTATKVADPLLQLPLALTLRLAGKRLASSRQQLLAPRVVERLRDLVRPAQLFDRHVAAQPREHDLELLLDSERPVLTLLAQPDLLSVERPILRGAPDAIAAPPRPYGPRVHADRVQQTSTRQVSTRYLGPGHRNPLDMARESRLRGAPSGARRAADGTKRHSYGASG